VSICRLAFGLKPPGHDLAVEVTERAAGTAAAEVRRADLADMYLHALLLAGLPRFFEEVPVDRIKPEVRAVEAFAGVPGRFGIDEVVGPQHPPHPLDPRPFRYFARMVLTQIPVRQASHLHEEVCRADDRVSLDDEVSQSFVQQRLRVVRVSTGGLLARERDLQLRSDLRVVRQGGDDFQGRLYERANVQLDLFDHSVSDHVAAARSLCCTTLVESKGSIMDTAPRKSYPQKWNEYTAAQVNEKAKFLELLYSLCSQIEDPPQRMGRPRIPLADRIFATVFKVYSTVSGRRFMSDLRDARQREYISTMPNFSILSRSLESEELTPYLKQMIIDSSLPLKSVEENFAIDSTGFRTKGYSTWFSTKYNHSVDKSEWLKCHVMIGTLTGIVTSVEISSRKDHDSLYFAPLVNGTQQSGFSMKEISADKGYDSYNHRRLVLVKGAIPYIPFRSNAQPNGKGELWRRMYHFYCLNREEFNAHYHRRSNVESVFSTMKRKFGEKLRSKGETAQVNEALCKVLAHNLCCLIQSFYELGIDPTFASESSVDANVTQ